MADRYPLIIDTSSNQIKELPSGDGLNLTGTKISSIADINATGIITAANVSSGGSITAANFYGSGANLTGIDATAIQTGNTKVQTSSAEVITQVGGVGISSVNASGTVISGVCTAHSFSGPMSGTTGNFTGDMTIGGDTTVGGNLSVGGTITYQDLTNVDSVGLGSFRSGIHVGPLTGIGATIDLHGDITAGIVTATSFNGSLAATNLTGTIDNARLPNPIVKNITGNVTGNLTGNADSATTATTATNVTVADESSDATCHPLFATAATGNLAPKTGSNLSFDSSTGKLTATSFDGDGAQLTGLNIPAGWNELDAALFN